MNSKITQLETPGGSFRVAVDGKQDAEHTIIFSNSLGTTLEMWQSQVEALGDQFHLIRYDTRGHGVSAANQGPYSFSQLADDLVNILNALNVKKAVVCGISMGGHTALQMGISHPDRVEAIIPCNTTDKFGVPETWQDRAKGVREGGEAGMKEMAASTPDRWFTERYIKENGPIVQKLMERFVRNSPEGYASCCDAIAQSDLREDIKKISVPTLIIAGAHDPVTTVEHANAMQAKIQGSTVKVLEASHISNIEDADAFNKAVSDFVSSL